MQSVFGQSAPFDLFKIWYADAVRQEPEDPMAMTLATVSKNGRPSARIVLMRHFDDAGFSFFTNYTSRKGAELDACPYAALVFYWKSSHRQVRAEGKIVKLSPQESDDYFYTRHPDSQLGAWASLQSQTLDSRDILDQRLNELREKYKNTKTPRPPHWGGYKVLIDAIEFWQGQDHRLHDRELFTRSGNRWNATRLYP